MKNYIYLFLFFYISCQSDENLSIQEKNIQIVLTETIKPNQIIDTLDVNLELSYSVLDKSKELIYNDKNKTIQFSSDIIPKEVTSNQFISLKSNNHDVTNFNIVVSDLSNRLDKNLYYIPIHGQSVSQGGSGRPALNINPINENIIGFNGHPVVEFNTDPVKFQYFTPLKEVSLESPNVGAGNQIYTNISKYYNERDVYDNPIKVLMCSPGQGGRKIHEFRKGGFVYQRFMESVEKAIYLANQNNYNIEIPAVIWLQGENDYSWYTTTDEYKKALIEIQYDIEKDISDLLNKTVKVPFITYQIAMHYKMYHNKPIIALAFKELAEENENFYLSTPLYPYEYHTDYIHLTNESYLKMGAKLGQDAFDYGIMKRDKFNFLPNLIQFYENELAINFKLQNDYLKLVFDEDTVVNPGNYGFQLYDTNNNNIEVLDVLLVEPNQIVIKSSKKITAGMKVSYACYNGENGKSGSTNGPRGNVRDNVGDYVKSNTIIGEIELHNWMPMWEEYVTEDMEVFETLSINNKEGF